ncbi:PPC domain-containing protein [Corallococcus llansteffanensis]|uniref:PPC domain-containing protein n=1 Tax=Corallococcus llansteffanensis TaxID=2316731 RepID=UPI001FCA17EF|nr:PPC domain-containing protein [Corallococcus llansteffanensis]
MRSSLLKPCLTVLLACVTACGGSTAPEAPPALESGEHVQAVLSPPAPPASGDIVDSTAYLGPVSLPGAVQTQFTTSPQAFSFSFQAPAGKTVRLEVTHLGSSMYLDTGLFVYGPRLPDGSYGTTLVAQDDDSGYGQLSKVASLTLAQGGEYLAVVSTGTGAGKRFRLELGDPAAAPASYTLHLGEEALPPNIHALEREAYWGCDGGCDGELHVYAFPWSYSGEPTLAMATRTAQVQQILSDYWLSPTGVIPYADLEPRMEIAYQRLHPALLSTYGNGTENVQVATYESGYGGGIFRLFVILFPQSHKVVTLWQDHWL